MNQSDPGQETRYMAYVSEPITRCPPREKGRIKNLVQKLSHTLAGPPFETRLYIPSLVTSPGVRTKMMPEHVYLLDRIRVVESDYMLVAADHTSFGIGGEVEMATSLGKPVVIFSREAVLSRFLVGTPSNLVHALGQKSYFIQYREWRDLWPQLRPVLDAVTAVLHEPRVHSQVFRNVGQKVRELRLRRGFSIEALAARTGLRPAQLRILEKPFEEIRRELAAYQDVGDLDLAAINLMPHQLEQLTNIGLAALESLAIALEVTVGNLIGEVGGRSKGPSREAKDRVSQLEAARLASLESRAAQYDVTFREFERVRALLVDQKMEHLGGARGSVRRRHESISEQEFLDALQQVRGMAMP